MRAGCGSCLPEPRMEGGRRAALLAAQAPRRGQGRRRGAGAAEFPHSD